MGTKVLFFFALATFFPASNPEYIPPGPAYPCPKDADRQQLFPCVCVKGTDAGIHVVCENTGLAAISVGLGNIATLGLPIELLRLRDCKIARLFGPLFARSTVHALHVSRAPLTHIEPGALRGLGLSLHELYLSETRLAEFPGDALKELGNLTTLRIDGHQITTLGKDIFAGSAAAGRLERLHIVNGLISDVSPEAFQNLKKLKTLDLHGNRLVTLKRSQFKGLRDTEVLDLSHNNITKLDGSHIGDLTKLGWCNASHNAIADIPRGMFARNTVLKVVHLDNNKIKKLDTNSFRGMRFLRRLYLQDNQIADVGRGTFSAVTRIGTVDLARNRITKVDYQMFQQVKYAELINLAENQISIVETQAFTDLYLAVVNISHNQLTKIEGGAFVNCNNMTVLDLSSNNLTEISKAAFDENTYAFELQVSYNAFTDFGQIPIQNMTGIRILNASHNVIEKIPRNAFPKLYELHTVDVSYNQLKEIYNAVFQNLFSLRFLNLSHNAMSVIKPGTFGTLPTVLDLDLSHNQLRDVAKGSLAKLASCRRLDVSWNQLEAIFQIPISVGEVNLAHNALREIRANTWPTMNALLYLNLSSNTLEDNLSSDSFAGLLTLQKLDLSNNSMTRPPWQALNSMTSVQYLYMQNNNLTSLSKAAFGHLPTIFRLDLSNNQLTEIEQLSFKGLLQLIELSLRHNKLESIPNEAFKTLVSLQKLDLSHNALEKIDNKTNGLLDDCLSLEMLDLSHNNFASLTKKMFPSNIYIPYKLYEIDLSHNRLPVLTMDITHGTKKLRRLNLSNNGISDIRSNVLGNLTSLQVLDLSGNNLADLISRTSQDPRLVLPENITELYLQDNSLQVLPVDHIVNATKLKVLDVRNNVLTSFEAKLVKKMHSAGLEVYFEGNQLKCDCNTRALKHYLNRLRPKQRADAKYLNLTCTEPVTVQNENLLTLDEERLVCPGNTTDGRVDEEDGNTEKELSFDLVTEPDLAFRLIQCSQPSIYVHWYVVTTEDIADTYLYIRDDKNKLIYETEVSYTLRSVTIPVDDAIKMALGKGGKYDICIQGKNSLGFARKWFPNQCRPLLPDYASWPKKLAIDKRRLTKKKVKYSWFGRSSVLGLVSDSILITLCIFLGVCFRRLSDFDL